MKLPINPNSQKIIQSICDKLPHALLLEGNRGLGLVEIAKQIAEYQNTKAEIILPEKDEKIDLDKGSISVETIRNIYTNVRAKSSQKRVIVIDYAEKMTVQSQNAFLKLLEEPNNNIHFILLTDSVQRLLPTILSRTENIKIKNITNQQSNELLDSINVTDQTKRAQLLFIASGLPAELIRLNADQAYFEKRSSMMRDARTLIQNNTYEKLQIVQKYKDNRTDTLVLLSDMANMVKNNIIKSPQDKLLKLSESIIKTYKNIESNGNIRLCLAQMIL